MNGQVMLEFAKYSAAYFTSHSGIETLIDDRHAIAHNKVMIIDDEIVITGSYNFTRAAEKSNAENLVIITSPPIAQKYLQNWQKHRSHSQPYRVALRHGWFLRREHRGPLRPPASPRTAVVGQGAARDPCA